MRSTARALSAAVVAGAALTLAGPAAQAAPAPAPGPVITSGDASTSTSCGDVTGAIPDPLDAPSQGLTGGTGNTVRLSRIPGSDGTADGACPEAPGTPEKPSGDTNTAPRTEDGTPCAAPQQCGGDGGIGGNGGIGGTGGTGGDGGNGGDGLQPPPGAQHGVEAGGGGSVNDSVPALVAGGALIAAACAGAVHRLYGSRRSADC
ncbi:hypothetical protein [Streptomyces sp. NPDC002671]